MDNKHHINTSTVNMLIDLQRILHPKAAKYTILSSANGTFTKTGHRQGHKTSTDIFKRTEITTCFLTTTQLKSVKIKTKQIS